MSRKVVADMPRMTDMQIEQIHNQYRGLTFCDQQNLDPGENGIEADLTPLHPGCNTKIKLFIRDSGFNTELRPRTDDQKRWMQRHFAALVGPDRCDEEGALCLRRDHVFYPYAGSYVETLEALLARADDLIAIARTSDQNELTAPRKRLLQRIPRGRVRKKNSAD